MPTLCERFAWADDQSSMGYRGRGMLVRKPAPPAACPYMKRDREQIAVTAVVKSGTSRRGGKIRSHDDLAVAGRVLHAEADGIRALAQDLGEAFVRAIDILSQRTGRIVVTGMGKSGHIGRKIAATLASTGSPALFVHPAEASHGDLGMMARGD